MAKDGTTGYDHPTPPLPDTPGVSPGLRSVLELYAAEIREHASSVVYILGMDPWEADRYKSFCFNAASQLEQAAAILALNSQRKKKD